MMAKDKNIIMFCDKFAQDFNGINTRPCNSTQDKQQNTGSLSKRNLVVVVAIHTLCLILFLLGKNIPNRITKLFNNFELNAINIREKKSYFLGMLYKKNTCLFHEDF